MASTELIRALLKDVHLGTPAVIPKKKLLWLLGWAQDRPGAWADLIAHWREIEAQQHLSGLEAGENIVLLAQPHGKLEGVEEDWAKEKMRRV